MINREPEKWLYWLVWSNFNSFRVGAHGFWWMNPKRLAEWEALEGKPEDFVYEGTALFHGTRCHVVSRWESWKTLYIAVDDGRLRGIRSGAQSTRKLTRSYIDLLRRKGHQVEDENELGRVLGSISKAELAAIQRSGASEMTRLIDPCTVFWLSDYKEVAPGCWLPMTQGVSFISVDDKGDAFESARNELEILDAKVNEPLPATLFAVEFKEGEAHQRSDGGAACYLSIQGNFHARGVGQDRCGRQGTRFARSRENETPGRAVGPKRSLHSRPTRPG